MRDVVVEPQRSQLIPGFDEMKSRALELGVLGFSISGSGPSVFAWTHGKNLQLRKLPKKFSKIFKSNERGCFSELDFGSVAQASAQAGAIGDPVKFVSTRGSGAESFYLGGNVEAGLAPDGGSLRSRRVSFISDLKAVSMGSIRIQKSLTTFLRAFF